MAAVDAVEIANGDGTAAIGVGQTIEVAVEVHGGQCREVGSVRGYWQNDADGIILRFLGRLETPPPDTSTPASTHL